MTGSVPVSVVGLNTSLSTTLDDNKRSLQIGLAPLAAIDGIDQGRIEIALPHHPIDQGWMNDYENIRSRFEQTLMSVFMGTPTASALSNCDAALGQEYLRVSLRYESFLPDRYTRQAVDGPRQAILVCIANDPAQLPGRSADKNR